MTRTIKPLLVALFAIGFVTIGCGKKVTKVVPQPEPPAPVVEAPTPPPPDDSFQVEDMDARLREVLQPIYFEYDRHNLTQEAISRLENIASFLKEHPGVRVLAEGHCDERGSSEYNMGLGENRARAVKSYLNTYGISGDRIEVTSYGEERQARSSCGSDDSCHQMNRRVEWQVLAK